MSFKQFNSENFGNERGLDVLSTESRGCEKNWVACGEERSNMEEEEKTRVSVT